MKQAVYGMVFDEHKKQILLVMRRDVPVWVLPGGGLEPGESPEEGAIREVFEETGYRVEIQKKIAEYEPVNRLTQFTHVFACSIVGGKPKLNSEAQKIEFFPLSALPLLPPPFPGWIQDALTSSSLIRKKIEGVSYWILLKLLCRYPVLVFRFLLTKVGIHWNGKDQSSS